MNNNNNYTNRIIVFIYIKICKISFNVLLLLIILLSAI